MWAPRLQSGFLTGKCDLCPRIIDTHNFFLGNNKSQSIGIKLDQASEDPHGGEALYMRDLQQTIRFGL